MDGKSASIRLSIGGNSRRASRKYTEDEIEELHREIETHDHLIPIQRLCDKLQTNLTTGLTSELAEELLERDGPNVLQPPKQTPEYVKFLRCMYGGFALVLWLCALFCFILYGVGELTGHEEASIEILGIIIVVICLTSGVFAYMQESKNSKVMDSFKKMSPTVATVIRDGKRIDITADKVVVGDLVEIRLGDKIPADIRVTQYNSLQVENSSITGESEPKGRTDYPTDNNQLLSKNVCFFSSFCVSGDGKGIVIATGDDTMIGRLAGLTAHLSTVDTPLSKEIQHFVHLLSFVALFCGILFFVLSLAIERDLVKGFVYLLGIIIANVPEVLLITVTSSLTLTAKKMADKNCLVKNLEAVETLGSTSTICSDKTGTLTQNKMSVSSLWFANSSRSIDVNMNLGVQRDLLLEEPAFPIFVRDMTLCLRAEFKDDSEESRSQLIEQRTVLGDASETGILKFCEHIHDTTEFRASMPKVAEVPFNSVAKYQFSIHKNDDESFFIVMKGAPEVIVERCASILTEQGETRPMNSDDVKMVKKAFTDTGFRGERVLAYCDYALPAPNYAPGYAFNTSNPKKYNFPTSNYRFVGFVSLIDPPRPWVYEAVHTCRTAGIKVIMVTGDHPVTAISIAKKVGIIKEGHETRYERTVLMDRASVASGYVEEAVCVTGSELRNMDKDELDSLIMSYEEIVFARTSPQQKLLIVESCQRLGEIVAVTGDGVNDSPALRKADIGIAMGIAGTDVAKNAADMILMDDNFASIVTGIEEGRLIFDNLKKSIAYTMTSSVPEMLPMLTSLIFSIPLPFIIEMILCIDIGTDLLPAIALAYEEPEADIMRRGPRNPQYDKLVNERLISMTYGQIGMTQAVAGFYAYFCVFMFHGFMPNDLVGLRLLWQDKKLPITDSFGQTWDYEEREKLLSEARTAYFISIIITQLIDLVMCKTRINSICRQGMTNWALNVALLFEIVLTAVLIYSPGINKITKTSPIDFYWFLPCLPFGISLWIYDELRRWWIRTHPGGFMENLTYY